MTSRLRVGVLFGGRSCEHEVSVQSARSVLAALDPERYEAVPIGVTRNGRWRALETRALATLRAIEVAVLGNGTPIASVPGEIVPAGEFYDYRSKYLDDATRLLVPAPVDPDVAERLRALAVEAFEALDGAGLARIDFLVRRRDGAIFVNETNTLPGFTDRSMYPRLWAASGLDFHALIDRLIGLALERHVDRMENRTHFALPG